MSDTDVLDKQMPAEEAERRRMRPEDRRCAVLDAALTVFVERGFGKASLNDVAEQAGVTKGCLYHHFDSKEALLMALLRERCARSVTLRDVVAGAKTREEALRRLIEAIWSYVQEPGHLELMMLVLTELPRAPELARVFFGETVHEKRTTMRAILRELLDETLFTDDDVRAVASVMPSMLIGAALSQRFFRGIDPDLPPPDVVDRMVANIILHGI